MCFSRTLTTSLCVLSKLHHLAFRICVLAQKNVGWNSPADINMPGISLLFIYVPYHPWS